MKKGDQCAGSGKPYMPPTGPYQGTTGDTLSQQKLGPESKPPAKP